MHASQPLPALRVIARGWDFEAWSGGFYPEDLPGDWRLAYYANEFRGVLVPDAVWREADAGQLAAWFEDLAAPFEVFLELSAEMPAAQVEAVCAALPGGVLQGVLLGEGVAASPFAAPVYRDRDRAAAGERPCWRPGRERGGGLGLLEIGLGAEAPPRALRERLEAFLAANRGCEQATLVVTGAPPSFTAMHQLELMGQLLGA